MAAHVTILDLTRRHNFKVSLGKHMSEVRDEACDKFSKRHKNFDLKNNGKAIDLSQTWQQCGLSPGAKLELIESSRSPSPVSIALQLPPTLTGGRLTETVRSDTTLWHVIRRFEEISSLNITQRGFANTENGKTGAGRMFYEMPRLNIMRRDLFTFGDLQKTLSQLGFNGGNILIKLDFKRTEQPLEEAMMEIDHYFKELETAQGTKDGVQPRPERSDPNTNLTESVSEPEKHDSQEAPDNTEGLPSTLLPQLPLSPSSPSQHPQNTSNEAVIGPNNRPISIFAAPNSSTPQAALLPHNEADYVPSLQHIKMHESRMSISTQNRRLLSDLEEQQLNEEKLTKLASIQKVTIKIRFPDQMCTVTEFTTSDSASDVYDTVKDMIADESQPFKLVYQGRGPQTIPKDPGKKLIHHLGFQGNMLVTFHWEDTVSQSARKPPILKDKFRSLAIENQFKTALEDVEGEKDEEKKNQVSLLGNGKENDGVAKRGGGFKTMMMKHLSKK